jgi:CRISPR system Cascade subunit CasD
MKCALLIACVGPMQSWGTRSRFQERDTEREPSKSGVLGMLCAALGRDRSEGIDDLAELTMGVRVDREGLLRKDFQTAQNVIVAKGDSWEDLVSNRYYLADGAFLVGLEGDLQFLRELHAALLNPRWPLYLGRKSYIPSTPPYLKDGVLEGMDLQVGLAHYPLLIPFGERDARQKQAAEGKGDGRVRLLLESALPTHETRRDQPVSFALGQREFNERYVMTEYLNLASWPGKGGS